ncbi:hypothetical protein QNE93_004217 [Vibrio vulnificus]|nr:hypothetical protein [Vibrio vulnificus]EJV9424658.1 hypothetical protein [Vibrio vulnificus]ELV8746573.1 hypothetical protein [Vibrio vulnificus]ELV8755299.1 hypothetical protein [Vibrio vulnificus]
MDTKAELEEAWEVLRNSIYSELDVDSDREVPVRNPLRDLNYCVELGMYPPPEVLMSISDTYQKYMALKGKINLEEAFFGKPQKGKGNFSSRSHKDSDLFMFQLLLSVNSVTDNKSQYEVASEYLERESRDEDPEHLLRKMRRRKQESKKRI